MKKYILVLLIIPALSLYAQIPNPPSGLTATALSYTSIRLNWIDNSNNETGFKIERSINGINWLLRDSVSSNTSIYNDYGLTEYMIYYYRIYAYNQYGNSAYSNIAYDTTFQSGGSCGCCLGVESVNYPFTTSFKESRTQMLYKISELGNCFMFPMWQIYFYFDSVSNQPINLTIKAQNTSDTVINAFKNTGWTTVFNGTYIIPGKGWKAIGLSGFFGINNNLLLEICFHNTVSSFNSKVYSSYIPNKTIHRSSNAGTGCSLDSGIVMNYRPNIKIPFIINTVIKISENTPSDYNIEQNYPNPFNSNTKFRFSVNKSTLVRLSVFDVTGKLVCTLLNVYLTPGVYEKSFSLEDYFIASGIYYYVFNADDYTQIKRMVVLK